MIYVNVSGRLGNQLFYYAIARKLQILGGGNQDICFNFENVYNHREGEAEKLGFEDSLQYFNTVSYTKIIDIPMGTILKEKTMDWQYKLAIKEFYIQDRLQKYILQKPVASLLSTIDRCCNRVAGLYFYPHRLNEKYNRVKLRPAISKKYNWFVMGRYENPKWFDDIRPILLEELTPRFPPIKDNEQLYHIIKKSNSVCISIRRGDYLSPQNEGCFNVCTETYFKRAIQCMKEKIKNPVFVLFSDDIEWVKNANIFDSKEQVYYESGNDPVWEKLRLMYSCKHYIISNSTFSWWAQYLSRNDNKIVIAPDIWFRPNTKWPLLEKSFIKITH